MPAVLVSTRDHHTAIWYKAANSTPRRLSLQATHYLDVTPPPPTLLLVAFSETTTKPHSPTRHISQTQYDQMQKEYQIRLAKHFPGVAWAAIQWWCSLTSF